MALTDEQKKKIISLHSTNEYSIAELSRMFNVNRTIIYRIVDPEYYENSKKSSNKYSQKNREELQKKEATTYTRYSFKFHNENDKDIIDKFASTENVQGYIKSLIRADILSNNKVDE